MGHECSLAKVGVFQESKFLRHYTNIYYFNPNKTSKIRSNIEDLDKPSQRIFDLIIGIVIDIVWHYVH